LLAFALPNSWVSYICTKYFPVQAIHQSISRLDRDELLLFYPITATIYLKANLRRALYVSTDLFQRYIAYLMNDAFSCTNKTV
jgi:hypothetical protein